MGCAILAAAPILTAMALPARAAREEPAQVVDVRVAQHDDGSTRFVLELSKPVMFSVVTSAEGVLIDTPELDWRARAAGLLRPVGLISGYSYATPKPGSGRLIIDTGGDAAVQKAFILPAASGDAVRLVVDLVPAGSVPPSIAITSAPAGAHPPSATPLSADPLRPKAVAPAALVEPAAASIKAEPETPKPAPAQQVAALAEPKPAPPAPKKAEHGKPVVVIDPGHGGVDPGTTSVTGEFEKNIVLALALAVKEKLDRDGKVRCILTRDDDTFVPLPDRVAFARANDADLFMSLHADSEADADIRGLSVYTLSKTASDATAQALADKENKADLVAGLNLKNANPEVTNILIDLVQRETLNLSAIFAARIIDEVGRETHTLLQNTHRFAGFAVLKAPDVPSVLVETGYLSNKQDERQLRQPEYRSKLATALARAIEIYFARTREARRG